MVPGSIPGVSISFCSFYYYEVIVRVSAYAQEGMTGVYTIMSAYVALLQLDSFIIFISIILIINIGVLQ